jgi:O-antigen/teichoic acid export membrane protein
LIKSFGRDLVIYGLSSSISKFFSLFLVPVYTRIFTPEEFGTIDLIGTIVAFVSIIGMMQLESAVSRYYYAEIKECERNEMISTALWSIVLLSSIIFLLWVLLSKSLTSIVFNTVQYANVLFIAGLTIPISNLNSLCTVIIRFKKKPVHYLAFQSSQMILSIGVTVWLVVYIKTGIIGVFAGQLAGLFLTAVGMSYYLRNHIMLIWQWTQLKKMLRFSLPLVPSVAGSWANSYINRFVMVGYLSIAEIGLYAVALKFASLFNLLDAAFRMAWGPFFWETYEKNADHRNIFRDIQSHTIVLIMCLVILVTLFSKEIILTFTTFDYLDAAPLFGLLSLAIGISTIINQTTSLGPGITKRTEYNTIIYFLSVTANVGALFLLVPTFGLIAVPICLLFGSLTLWISSWYNSESLYKIGFRKTPALLITIVALLFIIIDFQIVLPTYMKIIIMTAMLFTLFMKYRVLVTSFVNPYKQHS